MRWRDYRSNQRHHVRKFKSRQRRLSYYIMDRYNQRYDRRVRRKNLPAINRMIAEILVDVTVMRTLELYQRRKHCYRRALFMINRLKIVLTRDIQNGT